MDGTSPNTFEHARIAPKLHHPATFLERGVALPMTTPLLAGSRARPSDSHRLELIILNPSGGRGVYIVSWAGIVAFCRPTVHDTVFIQRIANLSHVTPSIIRRVARQIAVEGLAGEDASDAAASALEADKGELILANYQLLMLLFQQVTATNKPIDKAALGSGVNQAVQLRLAVDTVSVRIGQSGDWTASALENLAELMSGLGVGGGTAKARIQIQIEMLRHTRADILQWTTSRNDETMNDYGTGFAAVAALTLRLAESTLAEARKLTADVTQLLARWAFEPDGISELVSRPEWLLDGWDRICAIWRAGLDTASKELALAEIAGLVPVMPKEVNSWSGLGSEIVDRNLNRYRRIVPYNVDWFTGASVYEAIARNEHLRAISC